MAQARPAPPAGRIVRAAGAVVWRLAKDAHTFPGTFAPRTHHDLEVLLVHRPSYDDWSWPKGKRERGETLVACATREVEEETGYPVRLEAPLTTQRYQLGARTTKVVKYWAARVDISDAALTARAPAKKASKKEIDKTRWVSPHKAMRLLTRRGDRRLLSELLSRVESRRLDTRAIIFLRHAQAITRETWSNDHTRPLTREGVSQVGQLTGILSGFGVDALMTSPWRRCLATVGPYAMLTGVGLDMNQHFTEAAYQNDRDAFQTQIRQVIREYHSPTVVCLHRPTIPAVVGELAPITPNVLGRMLPQHDPYLDPAEGLVVHISDQEVDGQVRPRVVDMERVRPAKD